MAYYKDAPSKFKPRRDHAAEGSWDDEGSHYSRPSDRRFGPRSEERSEGGRHFDHRGQRPEGDRFERRSARPEGDRFDRRGFRPEGNRFEHRSPRPEGDRFERRGPRPEGDRFGRRVPRPEGDRFEHRSPRPEGKRFERKPLHEEFAPPAKPSYRDFEHRAPAAPVVEREEDMSPDNLLTGRNPIREAIKSGRDIEKMLVQKGELSGSAREIVQMAKEKRIPVQEVEKNRLDEIAPHHQGMVAFASAYAYSTVEAMLAEAEEKGEAPLLVLLDGVTDPHNLGAIIRSAECAGAHGVIVPERRSVGLTPAAVKASAGAVEHCKVARVNNLNRLIDDLKKKNIWTYALTMDGEDYNSVNFDGGVALVVGSEGEGISRLTLESCDQKVSLPMKGAIDSLNASVAAGIMLYRVLATRGK